MEQITSDSVPPDMALLLPPRRVTIYTLPDGTRVRKEETLEEWAARGVAIKGLAPNAEKIA